MESFSFVLEGVRIIGWVLLNFLWQGLLFGLLYSLGRTVLPRGAARYRLGIGVLLLLAACPVLTTIHLLHSPEPLRTVAVSLTPMATSMHGSVASGWHFDHLMDAALPWVVLAWALCVCILSSQAWRQWRRLKLLVSVAEAMPAWQQYVTVMAQRFGLRRRVAVLRSKLISTPVLIGWLRPVILLPVAVVSKFPVEQIELILAHELAHLRRWDPLVNLFQVVLETLFFYHPVVHWISRDVRNEREICCDDLALTVSGGSRHAFGVALTDLGELREQYGSLLVAANGGVLLDRVQYLMLPPREKIRATGLTRLAAAVVGAILLAMVLRWEFQQSRVRQDLPSLAQLQTAMSLDRLFPAVSFAPALHLADLAIDRVTLRAQRPFVGKTHKVESTGLSVSNIFLPLPVPRATGLLRIADLAPTDHLALVEPARIPVPSRAMPAPAPITMRQPSYPREALLHHTQGQVVMEFAVSANGRVKDLTIVQAEPAGVFDQAASRAMKDWKFAAGGVADGARRYRQTMVFSVAGGLSNVGAAAGLAKASSRVDCEMVTGSHICRRPDESGVFALDARRTVLAGH